MTKDEILEKIRDSYARILRENLIGIYVHGSIAFGCFDPRVSDIDFLVVVARTPSLREKTELIRVLLELEPHCPPKGLEMSVVLAQDCDPFVYPTPYELHYSGAYSIPAHRDIEAYCANMHGTDKDLAAHVTVTRAVGQVLCGKPIHEVFGEVSREYYLDSIRFDVENAIEDICDNPVYIILNLCRVAAFLRHGAVLSKKDGGLWGLEHVSPRYQTMIRSALVAYTAGMRYVSDCVTEREFAAEMLKEIFGEDVGK